MVTLSYYAAEKVFPHYNAMAVANLVWGFGAILFGAWSDKFGAGRAAATGVICSALGFVLITQVSTGAGLMAAGVLLGAAGCGGRQSIPCDSSREIRRAFSAWSFESSAASFMPSGS